LNGHGPAAADLNKYWKANLGLKGKGVDYNIGPTPDTIQLNLVNEQDYQITPLWDVIGVINGTLSSEVIVVGNHRDAWVLGGAGDPNSGSAAINEVIRAFGHAVSQGWKPLRTIVFASWDGEEYGLVGSTEWVEDFLPWLKATDVAYVNLDVGCSGPKFTASASPLLNKLIIEATSKVQSPNQTVEGQTIHDVWNLNDGAKIRTMGSGSDFTPFQDHAGIASLDMGFTPDDSSPVYHYHSNYDSFYWMDTYGDPGFHYHAAISRVLGFIVAKLANKPLVPFSTTDYGLALERYVSQIEAKLDAAADGAEVSVAVAEEARYGEIGTLTTADLHKLKPMFKGLHHAAADFLVKATVFDSHAADLAEKAGEDIPWWKWWSKLKLFIAIRKANSQLKFLERQFLYEPGLDGRDWFKHVIFAPGLWTGYAGAVFPSLDEAIGRGDVGAAAKWIGIILGTIEKAGKSLEH
jgi:N-acetylated-alpha-linked acidic dipeptidase